MFLRRRHREVPELNTTSTADISFMLLVFFLVTSSMDTDKGLPRQLPPLDNEPQKEVDISRSNVMQIRLDSRDSLWIDEQQVSMTTLRQQVVSFVASRQTDHYVVGVQTDRKTSYEAYFQMQNTIVEAFHDLREKMARTRYGHSFSQCTEEERNVIISRYPLRVSEAQPTQEH
ncbi:MAG: biopolymer transporter ExbD [Prevotella sp.]|nr:biopolymer transporter ExbD [Prevotella sp.]